MVAPPSCSEQTGPVGNVTLWRLDDEDRHKLLPFKLREDTETGAFELAQVPVYVVLK